MPGYIHKLLQQFKRIMPKKPVNTPYKPPPRTHGKESQTPAEPDTSAVLDKYGIRELQHIFRAILYYAREIYCIGTVGLSSRASK